jgi:hypothetical protein
MVLESVFSGIVRIEMDYDAMIAAAKSDTVKKALGKLKAGKVAPLTFREGLEKIRDEIDTKNNPKDVEEHLQKYHDALVILPMMDGNAAPANVNARVNAVRNAFTRRVGARKAARKAESAAKRTVKAPKTSAEKAANKAHKEQRAAEKKALRNMNLATLRGSRKGRAANKEAAVEALLASITLEKPPAYIQNVIDALRSQILRFSKAEKERVKQELTEKVEELKLKLSQGQRRKVKPMTAAEVSAYSQKISAMETLAEVVEMETNVEGFSSNNENNSNKSKAASAAARAAAASLAAATAPAGSAAAAPAGQKSAGRSRAVGSPMTCKVLHHPCNTKFVLDPAKMEDRDILLRAALSIKENGYAIREEGFPGTEGSARPSRSRASSVAAASEGAAAGAGGK